LSEGQISASLYTIWKFSSPSNGAFQILEIHEHWMTFNELAKVTAGYYPTVISLSCRAIHQPTECGDLFMHQNAFLRTPFDYQISRYHDSRLALSAQSTKSRHLSGSREHGLAPLIVNSTWKRLA
jgi:hypothetical protein